MSNEQIILQTFFWQGKNFIFPFNVHKVGFFSAISVSGGNLLEILPKWGSVFTVEADITVTKIVEGTVQTFFATR